MVTKTIACLANSFRSGGSCVAGLEIENGHFGSWVRPVSRRLDHAISDNEKTYPDGSRLAMLDVIEVSLDAHQPKRHQTENWLITEGVRWKKVGRVEPDQLAGAISPKTTPLWWPASSTYTGINDLMPDIFADQLKNSLALVRPESANVNVVYNWFGGKNEVWVSFLWAGKMNKIKLTDPVHFARFNNDAGDHYVLTNPYLCISLELIWAENKTASKIVAGLIE